MRHFVMGLVFTAGILAVGTEAKAQIGGLNDPSFAYYALYLPRQAAQAAAPGPEATINQNAAVRQFYAATNRNGMFDPNSNGTDSLDFGFDPSARGSKGGKRSYVGAAGKFGVHGGNLTGLGPQGFYNNQSLTRYYRDLKTGRGRNANVSVTSSRRGFSGGYGGAGGVPGPR